MGFFDFLRQKPNLTNEDLLPHLMACIDTSFEEEDKFRTTADIDDTVVGELSCVVYSIDPLLAYKDKEGTFGWIQLWNEYEDTINFYLVRISSIDSYKTLLSIKIEGNGHTHTFQSIRIPEYEGGVTKTLNALISCAEFNSYTNPPPYCVFAKMIS